MRNNNIFFDKLFTRISIALFFSSFFWFKPVVDFLYSYHLKSWVQTLDPFFGIMVLTFLTAIVTLTPPLITLMIARHFHLREKSNQEELYAAKKAANLYINTHVPVPAETVH